MLVPHRPGRPPACSDAEVLTFALVRHLLARPSERAFLDEVRGAWASYLPVVPAQNAFNHRVRWLWGTFASLCQHLLATVPGNSWQQLDTTTVPVKHPSRVRGPESWCGPRGLHASFGWDAAHHEWFFGFHPGVRTDLDRRLVRTWALVPAAVDERVVANGLLAGAVPPAGSLLD